MAIQHYYYANQLKQHIVMFANVFAGLTVRTGKNECGETTDVAVPITYASKDGVVAHLASSNTQNKRYTLPMMSCYLRGLELAPDRMHGVNQVSRRTYLEQGGVFPDDVRSIQRLMPLPYNLEFELSIHASNTDQMFQIIEQVALLFDPDLQLQKNDAPFDWTKIVTLRLTGWGNEENIPVGTDRRAIVWTVTFTMLAWLTPPMEIRQDLLTKINIRIGDIAGFQLYELDENGDPMPFADEKVYSDFTVELVPPPEITDPDPPPAHSQDC